MGFLPVRNIKTSVQISLWDTFSQKERHSKLTRFPQSQTYDLQPKTQKY